MDEAKLADEAALKVEEAELFSARDDPKVREQIVTRYSYLVRYLAGKYWGKGEQQDDLRQVANVGLLKAINGFDVDRDVRFPTYATATILGELKRHFRDKGWALSVPRALKEMGLQTSRASSELWRELGRPPTIKEIAKRVDLAEETVVEALDAVRAYSTASLEAPVPGGTMTPEATIGSDDRQMEWLEHWVDLAPVIRAFPQRERTILYMRFFKDMTQAEIASEIGISQMHVSRLLTQMLEALRRSAESRDAEEEAV
jgi:RNA polymerase sigma-B factor